jgi:lysophospholipase L1-like esterase
VNRRRLAALALLLLSALLLAATGAGAASKQPTKTIHPPAKVKVGRVSFARTPAGSPALLVAVRYPLAAAGRRMSAKVKVKVPGAGIYGEEFAERVSAGSPRRADRRRSFEFVYEVDLPSGLFGRKAPVDAFAAGPVIGRKPTISVVADGFIDVDGDGKPELDSKASARRVLPPLLPRQPAARRAQGSTAAAGGGAKPFCASLPVVQMAPGAKVTVPLPACTSAVGWKIEGKPAAGSARLGGSALTYTAPRAPGTQTVSLNGATLVVKVAKPWATLSPAGAPGAPAAGGPVVRAMGDSVTAGFGYYSDGTKMPFLSLYECKPVGEVLDDACSSNSTATKNGLTPVPYAPDYGLSNNVSWAAQWANQYGVTNYKNFAVSGSEPTNWAPGGSLYPTTKAIEAEDPDYILITIGANPILANTLFGLGPAACALESDLTGGYEECVDEAFQGVHLERELKSLYKNLVETTHATIYLMQYHLSIPSSALAYSVTQIAEMAKLMNGAIATVAAEVNAETKTSRLQVVTPPHFDVGVSLEPVYPSSYTCSYLEYGVDGPSVQSTPTQDELEVSHPLSFCEGPKTGEPWVISGDTGIHPSAAGYAQMAAEVPAPAPTS